MARTIPPPSVSGGNRIILTRERLDTLAKAAKRSFTPEQEKRIETLCTDYLINFEFEKKSAPAKRAAALFARVLKQADGLIKLLSDIQGKETPQHHAVHVEIIDELDKLDRRGSPNPLADICNGLTYLIVATSKAAGAHKAHAGGRGRPHKNISVREFIWHLADIFAEAGGRPGAPYQDRTGKRDSPFLRWLQAVNACLPTGFQSRKARLPELAHQVCKARRVHGGGKGNNSSKAK